MCIRSTFQQLPRSPGGAESTSCHAKSSPCPASAPQHCTPGSSYTKSSNARGDHALSHRTLPWLSAWDTISRSPWDSSSLPQNVFPTSLCPHSPLPFRHHRAPGSSFFPCCPTSDILVNLQGHQSLPHPGISAPGTSFCLFTAASAVPGTALGP